LCERVDPKCLQDRVCLWGRSMEGKVARLLDRLNRRLSGYSRSRHVRAQQVEKEDVSKLPFIFSSRMLLGHIIRFPGYKYQRPDHCKKYTQSNTKPFWLWPQTLGVGVRVDLDKSSCIG